MVTIVTITVELELCEAVTIVTTIEHMERLCASTRWTVAYCQIIRASEQYKSASRYTLSGTVRLVSLYWSGGPGGPSPTERSVPMDTRMDRRSFLKNAALAGAALVAAPALLGAVEPQKALAAEGAMTANVWVKPTDSAIQAIIGKDNVAYMTNPSTPLSGGFPTSPMSNNAGYTDDGTTLTVTIPLVNTMFTLTALTDWTSGAMTIVQDATAAYNDGSRYTKLVVTVPSGTTGTFTFAATEYAGYFLFKGEKHWDINITL